MKAPLKSSEAFKSLTELKKILPVGSKIRSFLLYSGQVEASLAGTGRVMIAHTNRYAIYEFWMHLLSNRHSLAQVAEKLYPSIDDMQFYLLQEDLNTYKHSELRAALFFIMNMSSTTGLVSCGHLSRDNFNPASFALLKRFDPENIFPMYDKDDDLIKNISEASTADYTLVPVGKYSFNLFEYGKSRGIDMTYVNHKELAKVVNNSDEKIVLLYKNHPNLFNVYGAQNIKMVDAYGRPTNEKQKCEELIIANF